MLDEYLWGEVTRISPEAPVPVVRVTAESSYPGGAANVARNVRALCDWTAVAGVIGDDAAGSRLSRSLEDAAIETRPGLIRDSAHATIVKTRVVAKHQQVVRVDRERLPPDSATASAAVTGAIEKLLAYADGVILSDYAKGFFHQPIVDCVRQGAARDQKVVTVDPSPLNPLNWSGVTAIKPNRSEAFRAAGLHEMPGNAGDSAVLEVGRILLEKWRSRMILLTLGEAGMLLFQPGEPVFRAPSRAREVFDVSGAGDTAIAVFTVALCAGASPSEAAELANAASGIAVGKLGTAAITPQELIGAFEAGH